MKPTARLLARGFLLQALFNSRGQQRGGLAWIIGKDKRRCADEPFNVNPTLAGYAVGLADAADPADFLRHRGTIAAALSAVGDRIVWGLLRPLAIMAGLIASYAGAIPSAMALLLVYNLPELCLRWRSVKRGVQGVQAIAADVSTSGLPRIAKLLSRAAAVAWGCLAGFWLAGPVHSGRPWESLVGCAGVVAALLVLRRRGDRFGILSAIGSLLLAVLWLIASSIRPE
jgi:hypothetical protein